MKEWYYWNDMPEAASVTASNLNSYKDPYELLEAMRYKALDKWSIVADYDQFVDVWQGLVVDHGIYMKPDLENNLRVMMIYDKSPLYGKGVRRGWIIKKINNVDVAPFVLAHDSEGFYNLLGPDKVGVTNTFLFINPSGNEVTISSAKTEFIRNTVLTSDTLHLTSGVTGHLVLESFIMPSKNELESAFGYFGPLNIKDLILDLRYNGGGYLSMSNLLASYIAGPSNFGKVSSVLKYNINNPRLNQTFRFETVGNTNGFPRLVVITSRGTASASEALINSLQPYIKVVLIGDTTDGKPVGMNFWPIGKKYYAMPVTFKVVNSQNQSDYFEGFPPNKISTDDVTHDFNDREELCLKEAIKYLETGSFSTKSVSEFKRYPQFPERPEWIKNAFVITK
jgi:C-terminal processing protease CtpA/Prc